MEASGQYSLKSAYKLIQQQKGAWNMADNDGLFQKIWSIKAPPKVLHLVWRAAASCLPTKVQLVAARCWQIFDSNFGAGNFNEFSEWFQRTLSGQSRTSSAKIVTLCWSIWRARNDLVWNNRRWMAMKIVAKGWEYLSQWTIAQTCVVGTPLYSSIQGDGAIYWQSHAIMK
ncbi:uncharacterized protein LOC141691641 [Apium graveolens]|uniref:uncharacterized protein LOC141691641 n=1 Tax=Apium graveolens TaxID=4045 RepID=UPI003D78CF65